VIDRTRVIVAALLAGVVLPAVLVSGCASKPSAVTEAETKAPEQSAEQTAAGFPEEDPLYTPEYKPNGQETAVIKTSKGDITVKFYGTDAPIHVGNFVELVRKGFYDGTKFHRYVPGFVIQGGDPATQDASSEDVAAADGSPNSPYGKGGPGYQIRGEFDATANPNQHVEGALAMARSSNPDSAGSQFYFTLAPTHELDGSYTVFGIVTEGLDVVKDLRAGDVLESVTLSGTTE